MLVRKELLSPEWAERILSWRHTGFNVHGGRGPGLCPGVHFRRTRLWLIITGEWRAEGLSLDSLVRTKTKIEAERVGKYMIRPLLALERLTFLEPEGKVGFRWGRDVAEQEVMDYLEFIARVTSHIPDKGQVMVRYYGLYAHIYRSPEADVCGGEAPALPCLRAGCAHGGRGKRGIFLIIRDYKERKSIVF